MLQFALFIRIMLDFWAGNEILKLGILLKNRDKNVVHLTTSCQGGSGPGSVL